MKFHHLQTFIAGNLWYYSHIELIRLRMRTFIIKVTKFLLIDGIMEKIQAEHAKVD